MNCLFLNQAFYPTVSMLFSEEKIHYSVIQYPNDESPNNLLYITKVMFDLIKFERKNLTHIVVVNGPGSFTGTRIGVVDAKILAFALNIPLVAVNSLELIARHRDKESILAILSAGRKEYFGALFEKGVRKSEDRILAIQELEEFNGKIVSFEDWSNLNLKDFEKVYVNPEVVRDFSYDLIRREEFVSDPLSLKPIYLRAEDKLFKKMR